MSANDISGQEAILSALTPDLLLQMAGGNGVAYLLCDLQGHILKHNALLAEYFGPVADWDLDIWLNIVHPDDHARLLNVIRGIDLLNSVVLPREVGRYRLANGDYRWMVSSAVLQKGDDGSALCWHCFFNELPPTSFLEERIRAAVEDSETRYRALFDHSSDATLLLHNRLIIDCNAAALELYGVPRAQLLGVRPSDMMAEQQRSGLSGEETLRHILDLEKTERVVRTVFTVKPPGRNELLETEVTFVRIELGNADFHLVTVRDVTELVRAERELKLSNQSLASQNANLSWLQGASARVYAQPDLESLIDEVMRSVQSHYSAPLVHFTLKEGDQYHLVRTSLAIAESRQGGLTERNPIMDRVLVEPDQVLIVRDFANAFGAETRLTKGLLARQARIVVVMMLLDQDDELGALALEYDNDERFSFEDLDGLKVFVRTVALVLAKHRHMRALEYQACHDTLTGLYNRNVLHREFERWCAGINGPATLMLLDLNRFKDINDTLGHHVGDDLLCLIGGRLQGALGSHQALLCRLGGDEFAILICGQVAGAEDSMTIANNILLAIRQPFVVGNVQLEISASIGVALYPQQAVDSHALLRFADVAMYEAKRSGVGVLLYDPHLDMNSPQRLHLIADLNNGIRNRELLLHYQPKLDLRSGVIVGCEALVRWQHPRLGLLLPDEFVPLAEVGDTIHALTAFVIEEAVEQQQRWAAAGMNLHVAVNLSARNLIDDRVVRQIEHLAQSQRLTAGSLEIEITETALMHDPARAVNLLQRMAAAGARLAIDDFGSGYSSLGYLRSLPIDTLKIDRGFVCDMLAKPQDAVIVQSIISLAHNLKQHVVAEGVEDLQVMDALIDMGCDQMQGYYLSKPLPADELPDWLAAYHYARSN